MAVIPASKDLATVHATKASKTGRAVSEHAWESWHTSVLFSNHWIGNASEADWRQILHMEALQTWYLLGSVCGTPTSAGASPRCLTSWSTYAVTAIARTAALSSQPATAILPGMVVLRTSDFSCAPVEEISTFDCYYRQCPTSARGQSQTSPHSKRAQLAHLMMKKARKERRRERGAQ